MAKQEQKNKIFKGIFRVNAMLVKTNEFDVVDVIHTSDKSLGCIRLVNDAAVKYANGFDTIKAIWLTKLNGEWVAYNIA